MKQDYDPITGKPLTPEQMRFDTMFNLFALVVLLVAIAACVKVAFGF